MAASWETAYGKAEIESSLESFGGWFGWLADPEYGILALMWLSSRGEDLPEELLELAAVIASFGRQPIEDETSRRRGLEQAFRDVGAIVDNTGISMWKLERIREIASSVDRFSEPVDDPNWPKSRPREEGKAR